MKYQRKIELKSRSPLEYGFDIFGGKWKSKIICLLSPNKIMRFNAFKKELIGITDAVLASMLKELIDYNIIKRYQYNEIPLKVEYELTEKGRSIVPILQNVCLWSEQQTHELNKKLPPCKTCKL